MHTPPTQPGRPPDITEAAGWTCPFCPLACDQQHLNDAGALRCARASQMLQAHGNASGATALINGQPATLDQALDAAARTLVAARQPLFSGLGADVDTARALYPLACQLGAIVDAGPGEGVIEGLRALQDKGQFTATLAEVQARADVIVAVGGLPLAQMPRLPERLGLLGAASALPRTLWLWGAPAGQADAVAGWAAPALTVRSLPMEGDVFTAVQTLAALVAGRPLENAPASVRTLAEALPKAHYALLTGAAAAWPAHAALAIEAVHRVVNSLNARGRAAALWLGGGPGAATLQQTMAWLSGMPLRTRPGPRGLEHEPWAYGTPRLLQAQAVDAMLWLNLFDASAVPPDAALPQVVLGPPAMAAACRREGLVFIAVATPGIDAPGHVCRCDGTVIMPLSPLRQHPTLARLLPAAPAPALPRASLVLQRLRSHPHMLMPLHHPPAAEAPAAIAA